MFVFFDPTKLVKEYYQKYFVHPHNQNYSNSVKLSKKFETLRSNCLKYFYWSNKGIISFQPNQHTVEQLILNTVDFGELCVYTDESDTDLFKSAIETKKIDFSDIAEIQSIKGKQKKLLWISKLTDINTITETQKIKDKHPETIIYCNLDLCLYEINKSIMNSIDFFTFTPDKTLGVYGISLFGFDRKYNINPLYLGSESISFVENMDYELSALPQCIECGTQNYPVWFLMERYFFFLTKNRKIIIDKVKQMKFNGIKTSTLNFNMTS